MKTYNDVNKFRSNHFNNKEKRRKNLKNLVKLVKELEGFKKQLKIM